MIVNQCCNSCFINQKKSNNSAHVSKATIRVPCHSFPMLARDPMAPCSNYPSAAAPTTIPPGGFTLCNVLHRLSHTGIRDASAIHPFEQPTDGKVDRDCEYQEGGVEDEVAAQKGGDGGGVEELVASFHQRTRGCREERQH